MSAATYIPGSNVMHSYALAMKMLGYRTSYLKFGIFSGDTVNQGGDWYEKTNITADDLPKLINCEVEEKKKERKTFVYGLCKGM